MASGNQEDWLYKNVKDLRKRLQDTERSLQNLHTLDERNEDGIMQGASSHQGTLQLEDLSPRGEMNGRMSRGSHHRSAIEFGRPQSAAQMHSKNRVLSDPHLGRAEYENETLRTKLNLLTEENTQLVQQNQRLLSQLETASRQLQSAHVKIDNVAGENKGMRRQLQEVGERLQVLETDNFAQDQALREADERIEVGERELAELRAHAVECREENDHLKNELAQVDKIKCRTEDEREAAIHRVEELQEALDGLQKKAKDRSKKHQKNEEHLRENLLHADQEREQLLETNTTLTSQIEDLQEEIRRLQEMGFVEQEVKTELEQQNLQLRSHLTAESHKIEILEREASLTSQLRQENVELQSRVEQQQLQLLQCKQDISNSQSQLVQLETLASHLQENARKESVSSGTPQREVAADGEVDLDGSYLETIEKKKPTSKRTNTPDRSTLEELRIKLSMKESEMDELKSELDLRKSSSHKNSPSAAVENLKKELKSVVDRSKAGEVRCQELEQMISSLEEERNKHISHIMTLEEKMSDLEVQCASLDARLNQRSAQLSDLQREITEKANEVITLEREVRKKNSQMSALERQLDEKVCEVTEQVSHVTELEEEVAVKTVQLGKLRSELEEKTKELVSGQSSVDRVKTIHAEQCTELEKQIELLEERWDEKRNHMESLQETLKNLQHELNAKEEELESAKRELAIRSEENTAAINNLEKETVDGTERVKQLEAALTVCQEELKVYISQMEEIRVKHDNQLRVKNQKIDSMEMDMNRVQQQMMEKELQLGEMSSSIHERQLMLQQSQVRIVELEEGQTQLEEQVCKLEQSLQREKTSWQEELATLEKKLAQASTELENKNSQIQEMTNSVRRLAQNKKQMSEEMNDLEKKLHKEKKEKETKSNKMRHVETELRESRSEMTQKSEIIEELEDHLGELDAELQDKTQKIAAIELQARQKEGELRHVTGQLEEMEKQLQKARSDVIERDQLLEDIKHSLKCSQDELRNRNREVEELDQALKERQWELHHRAAQVTQLDMTMKEHRSEMEQRCIQLEGGLKKSQFELQQKSKQVEDQDAQLQTLKKELKEKTVQLQQVEQMCRRQKLELDNRAAKFGELDQVLVGLRRKFEESREENLQLTQHLRTTKEKCEKYELEITELKRDLSISQREHERVAKELSETVNLYQSKEKATSHVNQELESLRLKESQANNKALAEIKRLKQELEQVKDRYIKQINELQAAHAALMVTNEELVGKHQRHLVESQTREHHLVEHLERVKTGLRKYDVELKACKDVIDAANETIVLKEAQIARLEAKLSSADRASLRGTPYGPPDQHIHRRLVESDNTVSLSALPDGTYKPPADLRKSSSHVDIVQTSLNTTDASLVDSLDDRLGMEAIGGPAVGSQIGGKHFQFKGSHDLSTILDLSENDSHFTSSMNESAGNPAGGYPVIYPDDTSNTDPESLVGMYMEVKEQSDGAMSPEAHDIIERNTNFSGSSKIPKSFGGQTSKRGKASLLTKPTLASSAKSSKPTKPTNSNAKKSSTSGLPKPKSKISSVSGNAIQSKPRAPTSKPKTLNYYPANLYAAANTAKANIAKMMKTVDEMYTPTVDHHVSTYIQDISDVADISDATLSRDIGAAGGNVSDSSDDSDSLNDGAQSKGGYYDNNSHSNSNQGGNYDTNQNSNQGDNGDGVQSSVHSNNNNYIDKSTVSSFGYSTPDVGMCVSDSNLAVSSNPGTGSPSDVDDEDEEAPEIPRGDSQYEDDGSVQPEVELLEDRTHERHTDGGESDSSLEPGMQRAQLFVALNQDDERTEHSADHSPS